jgi:TonB family protein
MRRLMVLLPLLGWASSIGAAGVDPTAGAWQQTGPFKISSAADRCVATSAFKRGDQNLAVALEGNPTTDDYAMRLYAPGDLHGEPWKQGKFSLGSAKPETDWVVARQSNQAGIIIYEMRTKQAELISAGPSPVLKITKTLSPGTLTVAGLEAVIPLIDACSADLLERWGYSKEFQRKLASPPEPRKVLASYASPYDYPRSALSARAEGDTYALIDVGVDGRSSNCRVIRSSGNQEIDDTTCVIVTKRARYKPALTKNGEPVAAPLYLTFRWEIPKL